MATPLPDAAAPSAKEKREILRKMLEARLGQPQTHPLSQGQMALWFLYQIAPQSPAYNLMYAARVRSGLDVPALGRAIQAIIARHAILRTTYRARHGIPEQHILPEPKASFEVADCRGMSWEQLEERLDAEADRPFHLEDGPVLRVRLFTRSTEDHVLQLAIHHIAVDFWSLGLIIDELAGQYEVERTGQPTRVVRPALQYVDYVHWQAEMLAGPEGERLWKYWREQLSGELPVLFLPSDRPRPPVQTYQGAMRDFPLGRELADAVRALAKAEGVTPYVIFLSVLNILLYRYTGQTDILVGSPMAGRSRPELAKVVGYFSNPVVLRGRLAGELTFRELASQLSRTLLAALEHQDYPFLLLMEKLQPVRDPSYSALFQVMFMWDKPGDSDPLPGFAGDPGSARENHLHLEPLASGQRGAAFDLSVTVFELASSFSLKFQWNTDIFDESTMVRIGRNFLVLLEQVLANPGERLCRFPLLTSEEQRQMLEQWNATRTPWPEDKCVHELFEEQARTSPDAVALVFEDKFLSFQELNRRANQLAGDLRQQGVGPETLVGICVQRSREMVLGLLGILKAGGTYVPLDPAYPKERLAYMLEDAKPRILLTQEHLMGRLPPHGSRVICLNAESQGIGPEWEQNPAHLSRPHNLAYVIYTSGSTGRPKGVEVPHSAVVNLLTSMRREPGLSAEDVFLSLTSLSFDIAALEIFLPLITGARLVVASPEEMADGARLVERMRQTSATAAQATPATWQLIVQADWQSTRLNRILCGGEALPLQLARRLQQKKDARLYNVYGPTETTIWSSMHHIDAEDCPVTIGRPLANTQMYLLDSGMSPVPIGVAGELYIGGAGVARGYHNLPDLTLEKFVPNPFSELPGARLYKTGDLARFLADGNIEFLGRMDRQVKINGYRIELGDVEAALRQLPAIGEAVVVARKDETGSHLLVAYVTAGSSSKTPPPGGAEKVTVNELRQFLKEKLPQYMVPSAFVFLDAFPLTPNRKIDYKALPEPETSRPRLAQRMVAPRTPLEEMLAAICTQVLNLQTVGIHDNFFDLGGTSLRAVEIVAKANEAGISLVPEMLFEHQTIAEMAAALTAQKAGAVPQQSGAAHGS
jgi:amino acid adenylation domain-containing protein